MNIQTVFICLVGLIGQNMAANILVMLPIPFLSHHRTYTPIIKELAARGHNITMVTPFPQKTPVPNLNEIVVRNIMPEDVLTGNIIDYSKMGVWFNPLGFWFFSLNMTAEVLTEEPIQRLIQDSDSKFDLVITETFFMQEALVAFGHKFGAPVVNLNPAEPNSWVSYFTGNLNPYSYVPSLKFAMSDKMTYRQRIKNTFWNMFETLSGLYFYLPKQEAIMRQYFKYPGSEDLPPLSDILKNSSITLVDSHFSMGYPRPYHTNIIEIGGLSIREGEKLPDDIKTFMDEAKEGVIYFSFGSYLKSKDLKPDMINSLMSVFGSLKQRVLWKWEDDELPLKLTNVKTAAWLPQSSVLAHPNCVLFITHGGVNSLFEAVYNSVPIVGIPIFADQPHNMKFIEESGLGVSLSIHSFTEKNFKSAIETVLNTPSYKENVIRQSMITKDRPLTVLKNAVYWIEYVINHKGAPHLKPRSLEISWCRFLLLDVFAPFVLIGCLGIFIFISLFKYCMKLCRRQKTEVTDKKKNE